MYKTYLQEIVSIQKVKKKKVQTPEHESKRIHTEKFLIQKLKLLRVK